jgi:uncharacterized membrane protein YfcA
MASEFPEVNLPLLFLWSLVVGLVFSTVGAAGGILAGVGHISLFGIPQANTVKVMNQIMILTSTLVAVPSYLRQRRVVVVLGILIGLGSVAGALVGSTLSYRFLPDLKTYKPLFGVFTLVVAAKILHEVLWSKEKENMRRIEEDIKREGGRDLKTLKVGLTEVRISFLGRAYSFNPLYPVAAGFAVAVVSSALGVGGGFLLVPFMASVLKIPMFLVPGTSTLSILITMVVSIGNYINMGADLNTAMLGVEMAGVAVGSLLGPQVSRVLKERKLRILLLIVLLYIGVGYTVGHHIKETFGIRII